MRHRIVNKIILFSFIFLTFSLVARSETNSKIPTPPSWMITSKKHYQIGLTNKFSVQRPPMYEGYVYNNGINDFARVRTKSISLIGEDKLYYNASSQFLDNVFLDGIPISFQIPKDEIYFDPYSMTFVRVIEQDLPKIDQSYYTHPTWRPKELVTITKIDPTRITFKDQLLFDGMPVFISPQIRLWLNTTMFIKSLKDGGIEIVDDEGGYVPTMPLEHIYIPFGTVGEYYVGNKIKGIGSTGNISTFKVIGINPVTNKFLLRELNPEGQYIDHFKEVFLRDLPKKSRTVKILKGCFKVLGYFL